MERVNYLLQRNYLKDRKNRLPFIMRLNRLAESSNIWQFVESQIELNLRRTISFSKFLELCSNRRTVLLLDGFDEIATNASEYKRLSYFESMLPLISSSDFTIVSSRPSYFKTIGEFHRLISLAATRRFSFGRDRSTSVRSVDADVRSMSSLIWSELQTKILGESNSSEKSVHKDIVYSLVGFDKSEIVNYLSQHPLQVHKKYDLSPK